MYLNLVNEELIKCVFYISNFFNEIKTQFGLSTRVFRSDNLWIFVSPIPIGHDIQLYSSTNFLSSYPWTK